MCSAITVLILVYERFGFLDVVGPSDVFATAGQIAGGELYAQRVCTVEGRRVVRAESGLELGAGLRSREVSRLHTLLITGGLGVRRRLQRPAAIAEIRRLSRAARRVASVCTGSFLLAEAGLLDGRRATTHWAWAEELAARYPAVDVVSDELYVREGKYVTAAGVAAGIDLALALVAEDHGEELARRTSQRMVLYLNRTGGQSQFSERYRPGAGASDSFDRLLAELVESPQGNCTNAALSERLGMSERHLARLFRERLGTTPARWVQRIRVDHAREALESDAADLDEIARLSGFASSSTMRQAFHRVLGVSPAHYRAVHRRGSRE